MAMKVGDRVVATGAVKFDTDFGMGYRYPTLIEQATIMPAKRALMDIFGLSFA